MSIFPYRWIPSTIHRNLYYGFRNTYEGIWNIIRWSPIIFRDRDWDWSHLAEIMEYKLRRMHKTFRKSNHYVGCQKDALDMLICAEILRRMINDNWDDGVNFKIWLKGQDDIQKLMGKIIGRKMRSWWI